MEVQWQNDKLKKQLQDSNHLTRQYGQKVARKVTQRLIELEQAQHYGLLPAAAHPHPIKDGNKFLYYSVDLPEEGGKRGKWRLAFKPYGEHDMTHVKTITAVVICGIVDHHK